MKIMKSLFLALSVLIGSNTGLEAWNCTGCHQNREEQEQRITLCQNRGHQYCASCAINHQRHNGAECPQCIAANPQGNNLDPVINVELQRGIRCYNCQNIFNNTNHFPINPEPCHHRICVTCAYTLLQNRGYSQRFANYTNRRNAPTYHNPQFNDHIFVGRHGRHVQRPHMNVMHDNVVHERSQAHHNTAAQCPFCDRAYSQATCNAVHAEYNNRAISFGQYIWHQFGRNNKERIINSLLIGGMVALVAAAAYSDAKKAKNSEGRRTVTPPSNNNNRRSHHQQHRKKERHCNRHAYVR